MQRKAERSKRVSGIRAAAAGAVRKSGQLNFRIEPEVIARLGELSVKKRVPLGTMIRNWVVERLECEEKQVRSQRLQYPGDDSALAVGEDCLNPIISRIEALEKKTDELKRTLHRLKKPARRPKA
jgi:hypothetical protein